jgi:hypothetical protein
LRRLDISRALMWLEEIIEQGTDLPRAWSGRSFLGHDTIAVPMNRLLTLTVARIMLEKLTLTGIGKSLYGGYVHIEFIFCA